MNILSLFDGISCGQIALERANIKVDTYYASEIKQHAIETTMRHYPNTIQVGDITTIDINTLSNIDMVIGGSPCKGISLLNKNQTGLKHEQSRLFWNYIEILNKVKPKYFLLENTHGNKEATNTITEVLGVKPYSINSKLVSAQNRPRYYWTNIEGVEPPEDRNITTKEVFKYDGDIVPQNRLRWLTNESGQRSVKKGYTKINPYPKAGCITANGHIKWNENYLHKDNTYRFLSISELEVLQTLPQGYCSHLLYNQAYDVIGDGWTVDIIAHIFSFLPSTYKYNKRDVL